MAQAPEPPMTVNDGVLGKAEDFKVQGPARVCLIQTSIDLEAGETSFLHYLGIHWGGLRIVGSKGSFLIREGDNWSEPKKRRSFQEPGGKTVLQVGRKSKPEYLIYARTSYSDEEEPTVWVEGDALGRGRDREILGRIKVADEPPKDCRRRFTYGWDLFLGPKDKS